MARRFLIVIAALGLVLSLCGCIDLGPLVAGRMEEVLVEESDRWFEVNRIALIDVDGFIGSVPGAWFAGRGTTVADIKEKLKRAADDWRVCAVVLRINSPGGEVTACDTIHREVLRFKAETGKPVVAALMGLATSGGYYVAAAADHIVAAPTSVTGSIGVVMQFVNVEGLFGKVGLRSEVVKSGEKKDIASPMRAMTPEERDILQKINLSMFDRFMQVVRRGRPQMTESDAKVIQDGRILTGEQAVNLHMADRTGYLEEAFDEARALAGVRSADVILYRPFPHYNTNIYARHGAGQGLLEQGMALLLRRRGATFLYLWSPGF